MKIIRNGIEYELIWEELRKAYCFMRLEYNKEDIGNKASDLGVDLTEEELEEIAVLVDDYVGDNEHIWDVYWNIIEGAIKEVIERR